MGDAISSVEKEAEESRISKLNAQEVADKLRDLRMYVFDYNRLKADLIKLGYRVEENGLDVKIWKRI